MVDQLAILIEIDFIKISLTLKKRKLTDPFILFRIGVNLDMKMLQLFDLLILPLNPSNMVAYFTELSIYSKNLKVKFLKMDQPFVSYEPLKL